MIYIEKDFYSNFTNAVQSNDDDSVRSMLSDEISELVSDRKDLLDLFKKINISVSETPTNEELSSLIVSNIPTDNKLRVGISYLIAKNNDLIHSAKKEKERGKEKTESKSSKVDTVTLISANISTFIKSNTGLMNILKDEIIEKSNNKSPQYSEASLIKRDEQKESAKQAVPEKKKNTFLWVVLGLAVIGGGIYLAHKKGWINFGNKNNDALANGNSLAPTNVAPVADSNVSQQVVAQAPVNPTLATTPTANVNTNQF